MTVNGARQNFTGRTRQYHQILKKKFKKKSETRYFTNNHVKKKGKKSQFKMQSSQKNLNVKVERT